MEKKDQPDVHAAPGSGEVSSSGADSVRDAETEVAVDAGSHHLKRKLRAKEIQMYCMGTTIGTSIFVQMGSVLPKGGPASLLIGFVLWGAVMWCVNECFAELVCYMPIPSPFVTLGSRWVDDALGFAMSWNFFIKEALLVPYEIVAFSVLLEYWTDAIPGAAMVVAISACYVVLHSVGIRYWGIAEMYMATFKIALMCGLILFTIITMAGGNPLHDAFGFRYWQDPGAFVEYKVSGGGGRFLGVLVGILQAAFTYNGLEYMSMIASEAKLPRKAELPRKAMPKAFKHVVWRFIIFFIGSALCIGILVPYNDPTLVGIYSGTKSGSGTAAASPYVIAMDNLQIRVLPHIVNACILTSVFSSGNGDIYAVSRAVFGMSLDGKAPRFLSRTLRSGVPIYAVMAGLVFCALGFLQVNTSSAKVVSYLVSLVTSCQMLNSGATVVVYLHFYAACKAQGVDRDTALPYKSRFQPYTSYFALFGCGFALLANGWANFVTTGGSTFSVRDFFLNYTFVGVFPILFVFWKVWKRTKYMPPAMVDLTLGGVKQEIDRYEETYVPKYSSKISEWIDTKVF